MTFVLLIFGLLAFIGLVLIHEYGHFMAARRSGVDVEEFGLGFPPRVKIIAKKNGTIYTLNALPLGGFVRLKGEHDADHEPGSYGAASLKNKIKIMGAGVVMNLLTALVLLTFLALVGMPRLVENQFSVKNDTRVTQNTVFAAFVEDGSPAAKAGLHVQDRLISMTAAGVTTPIDGGDALRHLTTRYAGQTVQLNYKPAHGSELVHKTVTLRSEADVVASRKTAQPKGYLGVVPSEYTLLRSTWSAPVVAVGTAGQFTALTFKGLGSAVKGLGSIIAGTVTGNTPARQSGQTKAGEQVSGPVGIFFVLKEGSLLGIRFILMVIAVISLTLAIMNVLPIPALDGGRLFVTLLFRAIKQKLTPRLEERIHNTGFLALMVLFVLITVVDIRRFF